MHGFDRSKAATQKVPTPINGIKPTPSAGELLPLCARGLLALRVRVSARRSVGLASICIAAAPGRLTIHAQA